MEGGAVSKHGGLAAYPKHEANPFFVLDRDGRDEGDAAALALLIAGADHHGHLHAEQVLGGADEVVVANADEGDAAALALLLEGADLGDLNGEQNMGGADEFRDRHGRDGGDAAALLAVVNHGDQDAGGVHAHLVAHAIQEDAALDDRLGLGAEGQRGGWPLRGARLQLFVYTAATAVFSLSVAVAGNPVFQIVCEFLPGAEDAAYVLAAGAALVAFRALAGGDRGLHGEEDLAGADMVVVANADEGDAAALALLLEGADHGLNGEQNMGGADELAVANADEGNAAALALLLEGADHGDLNGEQNMGGVHGDLNGDQDDIPVAHAAQEDLPAFPNHAANHFVLLDRDGRDGGDAVALAALLAGVDHAEQDAGGVHGHLVAHATQEDAALGLGAEGPRGGWPLRGARLFVYSAATLVFHLSIGVAANPVFELLGEFVPGTKEVAYVLAAGAALLAFRALQG